LGTTRNATTLAASRESTHLVTVVVVVVGDVRVATVVVVCVMVVVVLVSRVAVLEAVLVSVCVVEGVGALTVKGTILRAQLQALMYSAALPQDDA